MRLKKPTATPTEFVDIEQVRGRLQEWRGRRKRGTRIPEDLWMAAVKLAMKYPPARIAHALGVDYSGLKQRLRVAKRHEPKEPESQAGFVELVSFAPSSHCQCTMEIEDRRGAKLKLELKGVSAGEVAAVSRALWRAE